MENQEIIELGSSDDEARPSAPKKVKPLSNMMVHIPIKVQDKSPLSYNTCFKHKEVPGKSLSVIKLTNSTIGSNLAINTLNNNSNGRCSQNSTSMPTSRKFVNARAGPVKKKIHINPINLISRGSVVAKRKATDIKFIKPGVNIQQQQVLTKLPPSITITRTQSANKSIQSIGELGPDKLRMNKKFAINPCLSVKKSDIRLGETLTVELDDDISQSSIAKGSPQWYLRPEEQHASNSLESKNNMEPEPRNMIEITIEDSPVKPCLPKETITNKDIFVLIEESPTKPLNDAVTKSTKQDKTESPRSKKQLNYPKTTGSVTEQYASIDTVIMEVDPTSTKLNEEEKTECESLDVEDECDNQKDTVSNQHDHKTNNDNEIQVCDENVIEKSVENNNQDDGKTKSISTYKDNDNECLSVGEFHPIVQRFVNLCCEIDKTDDMKKIIDKRIKNYYRQVSKAYVESEEFLDLVSTKIAMIEVDRTKMYLYLKDVVDELNLQRKMAKSYKLTNQQDSVEEHADADNCTNKNSDSKQQKQIRKLERTIKKLNRAIQKLEEQEVDFDDEEDSVYLLTERYKERLIQVYEKFCKMSNTKMPSEPHILIQSRPGQPPGPAKKLEKFINKKVPIGTPLLFPDFHDVLKCVREANVEDRLGWNEAEIMDEARNLFTSCGKKLQRRRQENEWRLAVSRITQSEDPADKDKLLQTKLDENKKVAEKKETEIFNRYADKQKQSEAMEIDDKEEDDTSKESEDEEHNDNSNSLDDRKKRKDRLRRLLEEKSIKKKELTFNETKENISVDSMSIVDNEDSNKTENTKKGVVFECTQKEMKHYIQETNKSLTSKGILHEEQNTYNIKGNETNIIDGSSTCEMPVKYKTKVGDDVYLISDNSDADELNLLQKLHSGNEISESSEYDETTVAVSDTSESNSESEDIDPNDVISIENSSYSESEATKQNLSADIETINKVAEDPCDTINTVSEINIADTNIDTETTSNYDENLLLASSEDEGDKSKDHDQFENEYINLKDDEISIHETLLSDGATYEIPAISKINPEYAFLNDEEITINEIFMERTKCVESINTFTDENIEQIEEKDDNRILNNCTHDKPSESELSNDIKNNEGINNYISDDEESFRGFVNDENKKTSNNFDSFDTNDPCNDLSHEMLTDNIENVNSDKRKQEESDCEISQANILKETNVCDKYVHFEEVAQTQNGFQNHKVMDCAQATSTEEIGSNMDIIGSTDVFNIGNINTTNECIRLSKTSTVVPEPKSVEMMLEEMFNSNSG